MVQLGELMMPWSRVDLLGGSNFQGGLGWEAHFTGTGARATLSVGRAFTPLAYGGGPHRCHSSGNESGGCRA
jgi:hypothetical protein